MSSRKLLAFDFIKRYFVQWGHGPALSEIAAALGVSSKRAHELVHQLAEEEMLDVIKGKARGIRLRDRGEELSEADVLLLLAARGWKIGHGGFVLESPDVEQPSVAGALVGALMNKGLPDGPELDHDPDALGSTGTGIDDARHS